MYKILAWSFGIISTIILCGYGIMLILNMPYVNDLPKELFFNEIQLSISLETSNILLPLYSGYILAAAPAIKYLKTEKILFDKEVIVGLLLTFSFGIIAIGLRSGCLAFLSNAAGGFDLETPNYSKYNFYWNRAIRYGSLAHLSFFCSVGWFVTTAILSILLDHKKTKN